LIAAYVSSGNDCYFCANSHSAAARHALGDEDGLVATVCTNIDAAPLSDRMRALLAIANKVRVSGKNVAEDDIAAARAAGANDEDLHDTVLIAAGFCLANRYVDGLDAVTPTDDALYDAAGKFLFTDGYLASVPPLEDISAPV
jgi:uncharacterized peroxidase-related enzyme